MSILGAHRITRGRAYSVHRQSGLLTIAITGAFAVAILASHGRIVGTQGWVPLTSLMGGHAVMGVTLLLCATLAIVGLAFDDDDQHRWPRVVTVASAWIGLLWSGIAALGFVVAWVGGYPNSGPFLALALMVLHANRLWLLNEFPPRDD